MAKRKSKTNCFCLVDRAGNRFKTRCVKSKAAAKKAGMAAFDKDVRAKEVIFGAECYTLPTIRQPITMSTRRTHGPRRSRRR